MHEDARVVEPVGRRRISVELHARNDDNPHVVRKRPVGRLDAGAEAAGAAVKVCGNRAAEGTAALEWVVCRSGEGVQNEGLRSACVCARGARTDCVDDHVARLDAGGLLRSREAPPLPLLR